VNALIDGLREARAFPHPAGPVRVVETHISWVLLTGDFAYKIKKPLDLGFLDYSTLALRQRFCEEELRVNRRYAPELYLDVVAITASADGPEIGGAGKVIEYAVRMRQFPDDALLADVVARADPGIAVWRRFGAEIAAIHDGLPVTGPGHEDGRGTPGRVRDAINQNFRQVRPYVRESGDIAQLNRLEEQAWRDFHRHEQLLWARYAGGLVRECHGDLHLGNIVLLSGRALAFDAIEFNPALSWIDVMNEMAFLVMDCESRGHGAAGFVALNAWLERSGDYAGLALLDFFCAYRAMVRAKVSVLGAGRPPVASGSAAHLGCRRYLALAERCAGTRRPFLAITCGVSGSGKSTLAEALAGEARAIRLRSDVERKRLHGLAPQASSREAAGTPDIYTPQASARTFARLAELAAEVIAAGFPVIVDATFIKRAHREDFRRVAQALGVDFHILLCEAPRAELERRIETRRRAASDPSEADLEVLAAQLASAEFPDPAAEPGTLRVADCGAAAVHELLARIGPAGVVPD
jgi:aminoglycoside phosphotransferase family enzyme/predicted kinase